MISSFAQYLQGLRILAPALAALAAGNALPPVRRDNGDVAFHFIPGRMEDPTHRRQCARMLDYNKLSLASGIDAATCARLLYHGPKVFRPTDAECEALSEIELKIPVGAYAQPFPVFAVEFPTRWRESQKIVGQVLSGGVLSHAEYKPIACVLWVEVGALFSSVVTDHDSGMVLTGLAGDPASKTLEEDLLRHLDTHLDCAGPELAMCRRCVRVAANSALLLMDRGFRRSPETNDALIARLESRIAKDKEGRHAEDNRTELAVTPVIYEFAQRVDVRKAVGSREALDGAATPGRTVRPHWRSAHWRLQPCGIGRSEVKRILIPHCMVHRERFAGREGDTTVVME